MQKIVPFLWFDNNAEEAMNFYTSVFAGAPNAQGESKITTLSRYPNEGLEGPMKGFEGKILTGAFTLAGQQFLCLDGGPLFKPSTATSMLIECDTQEEVDYYWEKLTEGGEPEAQQCGWLADKFGFAWQVHPKRLSELMQDPDKAKVQRVTHAMLQMKKIDVPTLEKAAAGEA